MAALPPLRRILPEDIEGSAGWFQRVPYILNLFMQAMYSALNGNLTFQQNFDAQIQEVSFTTANNYTSNNFTPITFPLTMGSAPIGMVVSNVVDTTTNSTHTIIYNAPYADWQNLGNGNIQINNISGLQNSRSYTVTLLLF